MEQVTNLTQKSLIDVDLHLLRAFREIFRADGFSEAQIEFGKTQATISVQMRNLEDRLGMRLCERGRVGFYLTEKVRRVHWAMLNLFGSIDRFWSTVSDAQGDLTGDQSFGTVDAMVTNEEINLHLAIAEFRKTLPQVCLSCHIASPQDLALGILNGRNQIVLMPKQMPLAQTSANDIFKERQNLYCGYTHPLFAESNHAISESVLAEKNLAGRSYMPHAPICGVDFRWHALTAQMGGTLILLLSGKFIGFLSHHYAEPEVRKGRPIMLAPSRMVFDGAFYIIYLRKRPARTEELLAQALQSCNDLDVAAKASAVSGDQDAQHHGMNQ